MTVHRLTRADACRLAVRAQLLTRDRPVDVVDVVRRLGMLQLDPTKAVAPSADLVLWSRLGSGYDPAALRAALDRRQLVELNAVVRPAEDIALHRADMLAFGRDLDAVGWHRKVVTWLEANDACRRDVLARLRADGPLPSRQLPDTCVMPWASTGWTNGKNVTRMLDLLVLMGEVAVAGRLGRDRLWDLAERVYPDVPVPTVEAADRARRSRRLAALGIARAKTTQAPVEPWDVGDVGEPAVVAGVPGEWRVDPALLDAGPFRGRTALLSPFDRLAHDRRRALELFGFDYLLEMYKPKGQRRWGYYALPVLHGDRLVGKVDATADHGSGVLRVDAVHEDVPFTAAAARGVDRELADLARWLRLDLVRSA